MEEPSRHGLDPWAPPSLPPRVTHTGHPRSPLCKKRLRTLVQGVTSHILWECVLGSPSLWRAESQGICSPGWGLLPSAAGRCVVDTPT